MESIVNILPYAQLVLAVLLIASVVLQQSDSNLGAIFGGGGDAGGMQHTRRGFEKFLFNSTIILGVLFVATALIALII